MANKYCANVAGRPVLIRKLGVGDEDAVFEFWSLLQKNNDDLHFHPHPFTFEYAQFVCTYSRKDIYLGVFDGKSMIGYGMLRGWDEGFDVPSLGISIRKDFRRTGLSKIFMDQLHSIAKDEGATRIRLTVDVENHPAVALYKKIGYEFEAKNEKELVGYKNL